MWWHFCIKYKVIRTWLSQLCETVLSQNINKDDLIQAFFQNSDKNNVHLNKYHLSTRYTDLGFYIFYCFYHI